MSGTNEHIFPVFEHLTPRKEKEIFLNQKACAFWMTGLSGSGKTTIAIEVERALFKMEFVCQLLDADNIRAGINKDLGFSLAEREENVRRIAEINKLFLNCGIITLSCFVSPTAKIRELAKNIIGPDDFYEIYFSTPFEVCKQRDPKGLYLKASKGIINNFTAVSSPYESPVNPDFEINTESFSIEESTQKLLNFILSKIAINH